MTNIYCTLFNPGRRNPAGTHTKGKLEPVHSARLRSSVTAALKALLMALNRCELSPTLLTLSICRLPMF